MALNRHGGSRLSHTHRRERRNEPSQLPGGKSTLVSLPVRFNEVTSGQILLDGFDLRDTSSGIFGGSLRSCSRIPCYSPPALRNAAALLRSCCDPARTPSGCATRAEAAFNRPIKAAVSLDRINWQKPDAIWKADTILL